MYPQISKKNAQIKKLKSDIKTVLTLSEDVTRRLHGDAAKQQTNHSEEHRERRGQLQEEIATVKKKLQEVELSNRNKEQDLRKVGGWVGGGSQSRLYYRLFSVCM